jgi:hypothetical protein
MNFHWEKAQGRLQKVTMADDLDRRNILLQLMASQMVSRELGFKAIGADVQEEMERILNERRLETDLSQKFDQEQQQKQQMEAAIQGQGGAQGGMQPGMQPGGQPPIGPSQGMTPDMKLAQADQMAQQLVSMPELQRKQQLAQIRKSDETLHALVLAKMDQYRRQAASQGQQMLLQQQAQGGAPQQ